MAVKYHYYLLCLLLLLLPSCQEESSQESDTKHLRSMIEQGQSMLNREEADSALMLLLDAADLDETCQEENPSTVHQLRYDLYRLLSKIYEQKNICDKQQECQLRMCQEAEALGNANQMAEAHQRVSMTAMVMGDLAQAVAEAHQAYQLSEADTLDFRAQTLVLLSQIYLQSAETDSASTYLTKASHLHPAIEGTEMFRLSQVYVLLQQGEKGNLEDVISNYLADSSPYLRAELLKILLSLQEKEGRYREALSSAHQLLAVNDTIANRESAESMARIHQLQHHQQMTALQQKQRDELAQQRATHLWIVILILALLLMTSVAGLFYRKKARIAHAQQLDALRLAEEASLNEQQVRRENIQLQKLYYEHLYAIILPILNAHRGKTGHIDLEETSWELIEKNTDMVLPNFTTKMRRNHPSLSREDVRFCCLIMMRVPNSILADIYGIAPNSVAMRKQRMKHKLDNELCEQTLETYLDKYVNG